ncbi:MAG: YraN family protein [Magnetococcales bacterium]|nr:YraN family protein [Magnetococcales bacterium]
MAARQDDRKVLGRFAEELAAGHLSRTGYRILERNVRFRRGELDIIALHGEDLVFCEVKARRSDQYGSPAEAIDLRKQRRLLLLGTLYLQAHPEYANRCCRFDAALVFPQGSGWCVEVIQNAFP